MATGTAIINFGASPGTAHSKVTVTGQAAIAANSKVEPWFGIGTTAEHNNDEHIVAPSDIDLSFGNIVAGVGFDIHGIVKRGRAYGNYNVMWAWI